MPMEHIVPILRIIVVIGMDDEGALEECQTQLLQLKEDHFVTRSHKQVEKDCQKAWHDRKIKTKHFQ